MTTDEPRGCACPGQCAAIADLAAERAARERLQRDVEILREDLALRIEHEKALAAERAAKDTIEGQTPWEFSCKWYGVDEIAHAIARDPFTIPKDIASREFAEWMTHQYRLAMNKGIQLGQSSERAAKEAARRLAETFEDELREAKEELARREANGNLVEQRDEARRELAMMSDLADALRKERDDGRETISRMSVEFAKVTTKLAAERDEARELKGANNLRAALSAKKLQRYGSHLEEELVAARERLAQVEADAAKMRAALLSLSDDLLADVYPGGRASLADGGEPGPV